jgi:hypothetical protein
MCSSMLLLGSENDARAHNVSDGILVISLHIDYAWDSFGQVIMLDNSAKHTMLHNARNFEAENRS